MSLEFALALCKRFEGLSLTPYLCPANVWTIGFGSTYYEDGRRVTAADAPITAGRAEDLLRHELSKASATVARQCPELFAWAAANADWRAFNAAADFVYNLGAGRLQSSTLRRKLRALDWDGAKTELMKWTRGGGRELPGLVRRRKAECALF